MRHHPSAPVQTGVRLPVVVIVCALACALAACSKGDDQHAAASQDGDGSTSAQTSGPQIPQDIDALRASAEKAMQEQRLYAPAGSNAMEYYLTLRSKLPGDATVSSALTDLMPYALIATEQDIASGNVGEAQRLFALMERVDPQAPALPRLRDAITQMAAAPASDTPVSTKVTPQQPVEAATTTDTPAAATEVGRAAKTPAPPAPVSPSPVSAAQAPVPAPTALQPATNPPANASVQQPQRQAAIAATPAQSTADAADRKVTRPEASTTSTAPTLRALRTQAPAYPTEALSAGIGGEVVVEFTVDTDGAVTDARIVSANPTRIFNRASLNAVRRWRFAPIDAPVTTRRTIGFKPDE